MLLHHFNVFFIFVKEIRGDCGVAAVFAVARIARECVPYRQCSAALGDLDLSVS